ncbi:response regulator [Flavisolibacter tropicus]|uniref:LuxR family transcriptional regulator n=1 Tax=Flavisolibacter tropicus TaxID=1492898 RepID=A0A172U1H8_9BACT|nr:response regulator transcription factor [Flavisolibacter tropicus]ANE53205.1 LuxR family transcriptional regulator [Flavisolibacter tropicus]
MKFLIVDDHKIIRDGLKQILSKSFPFSICDEGENAEDVFGKLKESSYDVVICDLSMPGRSGLDVVEQIKLTHPDMPILILSMHPEEQYALRALKAGAWGYLNKTGGADILIEAIKRVLQGRKFIPASVAEQLTLSLSSPYHSLHEALSNREFHIFKLIAEGKSISEISDLLSLGSTTISTHRARLLKKLHLRTNADLTKYALQHNLL